MRRLALACFGVFVLTPGVAAAQAQNPAAPPAANAAQAPRLVNMAPAPDYDYVQQAGSLAFDGQTMTLSNLAPATIYFSDRPYRISGQVDNATFATFWDTPNGQFVGDPPNAAITVMGANMQGKPPIVVELNSAELDGSDMIYGVRVLSGELPSSASNVALFVDRGERPRRFGSAGGVHRANVGRFNAGGYHPYHPYHPYRPYQHHPLPGPYCYHDPQAPECHRHPYRPYPPYHPYYPYYPGAFAAGAVTGAAIASANQPVYVYPIPVGPLPPNCYINSTHTEMICSVPLN